MKFANAALAATLPGPAAAANFVTGNRVSEDTFVYKIETCTDAKPCSLYLVRLSDGERVATIFENKAGTEFTAKIRNAPTGTYVFQATGGEDGKTRATTQFTFHNNLVTTGTEEPTTSSPPTSSPSTPSATSTSPETTATSSVHGSTGTSDDASTGTATGTKTGTQTGASTATSTNTSTGASTVTATGSLTSRNAVTTAKTSKTGTGTTSTPLTKGPSTTTTSKAPSATTTTGNSGNIVIVSPGALAVAMVLQWLLF